MAPVESLSMGIVSLTKTCEGQLGVISFACLFGRSKLKHTGPGLMSMANAGELIVP